MKYALSEHVLLTVSQQKFWTALLSPPQGACITSSTWEAVVTSLAMSSYTGEVSSYLPRCDWDCLRVRVHGGKTNDSLCEEESPGTYLLIRVATVAWRKRGQEEGREVSSSEDDSELSLCSLFNITLGYQSLLSLQTPRITVKTEGGLVSTEIVCRTCPLCKCTSYISEPKDELMFYFNVSSRKQIT